eukprot:CAMPEP_0119314564 /NCGR_PEP_ID=MMETSP1333-20130426/33163_1 /TAXON_ID=418940 /ORGANISM="Scyphosphaera apsteinii, Strain RCC1455" /LENGTH=34 /DNA_ID= /DNA_START= /DNA_END= /DNA_ORIENTATION=
MTAAKTCVGLCLCLSQLHSASAAGSQRRPFVATA